MERYDEELVLKRILEFAKSDSNIRLVSMNGSRVNPNATKDWLQDFELVFFVQDLNPYLRNPDLPDCFGEILILQTPDDMFGQQ